MKTRKVRLSVKAKVQPDETIPTFSCVAYSGGLIVGSATTPPVKQPLVIDLTGASRSRNVIANLDHEPKHRVGHVDEVENDGREVRMYGVFSAATPYRDEVVGSSKEGLPWEVSIEGVLRDLRQLGRGQSEMINGRRIEGPVAVAGRCALIGLAFCSQGADGGNEVSIAASHQPQPAPYVDALFGRWLAEIGATPELLNETQLKQLRLAYDAMEHREHVDRIMRRIEMEALRLGI